MFKKFKEWFSLQLSKNPGSIIVGTILLFNVAFVLLAALAITLFSRDAAEPILYPEALFYTVTMLFDAGCINYIVTNFSTTETVLTFASVVITLIGMLLFTGAVIGYITNFISDFISNANKGNRKLVMSSHVVILNWNSRASEIINDLLYSKTKQKVVVLVNGNKEAIQKEIEERLEDTITRENKETRKEAKGYSFFKKHAFLSQNLIRNNKVVVVVKQGDIFSSKQLNDISLAKARMIVILESDFNNSSTSTTDNHEIDEFDKGNTQTIKTLMQVASITSSEDSADDQKIIVEVTDEKTEDLVNKIIVAKKNDKKCNIVPVKINQILGQILSQFVIMPELNIVYRDLFSNKGAAFFSQEVGTVDPNDKDFDINLFEEKFIKDYMNTHKHAIPLTVMKKGERLVAYFTSDSEKNINNTDSGISHISNNRFELNPNFRLQNKSIVILGHNSKIKNIMEGLKSFCDEWGYKDNEGNNTLRVNIIDDQKHIDMMHNYEEYEKFIVRRYATNESERESIYNEINKIIKESKHRISILLLSDDSVPSEYLDSNVLSNLIYEQELITEKKNKKDFDADKFNIVAEIIDPKHFDLVNSYSVKNVVISNRYISKMMTQIGEKKDIFDFYTDILTYDDEGASEFESKEIYAKPVGALLNKYPEREITAEKLIREVYEASVLLKEKNPTIVIGYIRETKKESKMILFEGNQSNIKLTLHPEDKLIVYSNH